LRKLAAESNLLPGDEGLCL